MRTPFIWFMEERVKGKVLSLAYGLQRSLFLPCFFSYFQLKVDYKKWGVLCESTNNQDYDVAIPYASG
ncbi:hypothetical protein BC30090_p1052 (plasmid) [Bacillus cereus]|nr:hypothetical protein BCJMU02_p1089 [Bacillus cereus]BCC85882.1 hypothetical protein BCJMU75_p1165 [Bacillus cereus]BCD26422.1 hypothetical protein BC30090_p1052 [Bacillus cereus]